MATALEAALARTACALCAITDLVQVQNLDVDRCAFTIQPSDALNRGKKFSDYGIHDHQMPFFQDCLARCCPEPSVQKAVRAWPALPAAMEIRKVIGMLDALLLGIPNWDGTCMSEDCAVRCRKSSDAPKK